MLRNYLKVVLRSIQRNKFYSFINVVGLTVGMGCALLIFLYVQDELTFERFYNFFASLASFLLHQSS